MVDKELPKNQVSPVTPTLRTAGRPATDGSFKPGHGGQRRGSGRPRGSQNRVTSTFRDVLLQAVSEVGDSREEGKDGQGGLLGYLKKAAIREEKTMLMLVGRILPLKISTEVKEIKETMTIYEAIADLKACGMDELLAFYLTRYPVGRDEGDPEWAKLIDTSLAKDPPTELAPEDDTGNGTADDVSLAPDLPPTDVTPKESDTEKADMLTLAESIEGAAVIQIASGDREPSRRLSEIGKRWIVDGLRLLAGSGVGDAH